MQSAMRFQLYCHWVDTVVTIFHAAVLEPTWQRVAALAFDKVFHFVRPFWYLMLLCVSYTRLALGSAAGRDAWVVTRRREPRNEPDTPRHHAFWNELATPSSRQPLVPPEITTETPVCEVTEVEAYR